MSCFVLNRGPWGAAESIGHRVGGAHVPRERGGVRLLVGHGHHAPTLVRIGRVDTGSLGIANEPCLAFKRGVLGTHPSIACRSVDPPKVVGCEYVRIGLLAVPSGVVAGRGGRSVDVLEVPAHAARIPIGVNAAAHVADELAEPRPPWLHGRSESGEGVTHHALGDGAPHGERAGSLLVKQCVELFGREDVAPLEVPDGFGEREVQEGAGCLASGLKLSNAVT